jgi:hypothetical protein
LDLPHHALMLQARRTGVPCRYAADVARHLLALEVLVFFSDAAVVPSLPSALPPHAAAPHILLYTRDPEADSQRNHLRALNREFAIGSMPWTGLCHLPYRRLQGEEVGRRWLEKTDRLVRRPVRVNVNPVRQGTKFVKRLVRCDARQTRRRTHLCRSVQNIMATGYPRWTVLS